MDPADLLSGLDPAQTRAVTAEPGVVRVLAGAGSGKTRVLTRRVAHRAASGSIDPRRALVITFTRQAAAELRRRLRSLGLRDVAAAGTMHATALALVRRHRADRRLPPLHLVSQPAGTLARVAAAHHFDVDVRPALSEINWARARLLDPARYEEEAEAHGRRPPLPVTSMATLMATYARHKSSHDLMDFDDVVATATSALRDDPEFGTAQRWRFRHIHVDEFQDLTPLQYRFVRALVGREPDLFVVGDPDQSIYGWNGADPRLIEQVAADYPDALTVDLGTNYRSSPQIVAASRAVLGHAGPRPAAPAGEGPEVTVTPAGSDSDEAMLIARLIRDARPPGTSWSALAVLARTRQVAGRVALGLQAAGIPTTAGREHDRTERDLLRAALDRSTSTPAETPLHRARFDVQEFLDQHLAADVSARVMAMADEYMALDPLSTVDDAKAWLDTVRLDEMLAPTDAVTVTTFHAAKGREWTTVVVAGVEEGLVPMYTARDVEPLLAEERRAFYVAVTRATHRLHLTWAATRDGHTREPSRWITAIEEGVQDEDDGATGTLQAVGAAADDEDWRSALTQARSQLRSSSPATSGASDTADDAALEAMEALEAWRTGVARAARIEPSAVVADQTLRAIARAAPSSLDELRAVPGLGASTTGRHGFAILRALSRRTTPAPQ